MVKARNIEERDSWGKVIVIAHTLPDYSIFYSVYAHLERIDVEVGDTPSMGEQIGTIGNANGYYTGDKGAAHLHLAIMKRGPFPPEVKAYENKLTVKKAADYCIPTLFIESRWEWMKVRHRLSTSSWQDIMPTRPAPAITAYVEYAGVTLSLSEAVENGFVRLRGKIGNQWYALTAQDLPWISFYKDMKIQARVKNFSGALYLFPLNWGEEMAWLQARQDLVLAAGVLNSSGLYQIKSLNMAEMEFGPYADEGYEGFLTRVNVVAQNGLPNRMTHFRHNSQVLWRVLTYHYDDMYIGSMQLSPNYLY